MASAPALKDLISYLDSPNSDVSEEAHAVLYKQLTCVKDGWIIAGLLEYFLSCNSLHALDLLLNAPEHHDKHFLSLVCEGLRQPQHRFQYTCVLFHGLQRSPPASWSRRLARHTAIKELLAGLNHTTHPTNLVAGLMVVIVLVTTAPHDVGKNCLGLVLEMFWRIAHWQPRTDHDSVLRDYVRATMYSLFTRLYTLFPCNVVNYFRTHTVGMNKRPFFLLTMMPMIERVRLHPMLFTHTKEQELDNKPKGLEQDSLVPLMSFCRLSLDPSESSCEDPPVVKDPEVCNANFVQVKEDEKDGCNKCWVHSTSDNFFWSPTHTQSPLGAGAACPCSNTPQEAPSIARKTPLPVNVSLTIPAESPPERAIEATPETTPYNTPMLSHINRQIVAQNIANPSMSPMFSAQSIRPPAMSPTIGGQNASSTPMTSDLNSGSTTPVFCAPKTKINMNVSSVNDSLDGLEFNRIGSMTNRLSNIKRDREQLQVGTAAQLSSQDDNANTDAHHQLGKINTIKEDGTWCEDSSLGVYNDDNITNNLQSSQKEPMTNGGATQTSDTQTSDTQTPESHTSVPHTPVAAGVQTSNSRTRKRSVFVPPSLDMLQFTAAKAPTTEPSGDLPEVRDETSLGGTNEDENVRKVSTETNNSSANDIDDTDDQSQGVIPANDVEDAEFQSQGLGPPPATSMSELVRSVRTNRLRFLSQCGPPLNVSQIEKILPNSSNSSPSKSPLSRSKSCSNVNVNFIDGIISSRLLRKTSFMAGSKVLVESSDKETQTTSIPAFDPYEKLVDTFIATAKLPPSTPAADSSQESLSRTESPHILLENYVRRKFIDFSEPLLGFDLRKLKDADEKLKSQLHAMYCLLLLERQKREFHANRNRILLSKSKRMHVLVEQQIGLTQKLETYLEETRNLKSANIYSSSCYQKMKDARDRDNAEREAVLKDYAEGKGLNSSGITSLSRTVKTSKGEEQKEKVIVILHKTREADQDYVKDELYENISLIAKELHHVLIENIELKQRICDLEQTATKYKLDDGSIDSLQHEKEIMRQHMAIMKIQLTIKDEQLLESSEQLNALQGVAFDLQFKQRQSDEALRLQEEKLMRENKLFEGVTRAAVTRLRQLEENIATHEMESDAQLAQARQETSVQRNKVMELEENMKLLMKQNLDLENRLKEMSGEKTVMAKEIQYLANSSGYSRANDKGLHRYNGAADINVCCANNFASATISSELKPLPTGNPAKK